MRLARPNLYEELAGASDALDALCCEATTPIANQRHFDELEEEAQRIAGSIVAAFRGRCSTGDRHRGKVRQ